MLGTLVFSGRWRRVPHRFTICLIFSQVSSPYPVHKGSATAAAAGFPQGTHPEFNHDYNSHFYSMVSHRQGWACHTLHDQTKCIHNTSKWYIYTHIVIYSTTTVRTCTHTHAHIHIHPHTCKAGTQKECNRNEIFVKQWQLAWYLSEAAFMVATELVPLCYHNICCLWKSRVAKWF